MKKSIILTMVLALISITAFSNTETQKEKVEYEYFIGKVIKIDLENLSFEINLKKSEDQKSFKASEKIIKKLKENQMVKVKVEAGSDTAIWVKTYRRTKRK